MPGDCDVGPMTWAEDQYLNDGKMSRAFHHKFKSVSKKLDKVKKANHDNKRYVVRGLKGGDFTTRKLVKQSYPGLPSFHLRGDCKYENPLARCRAKANATRVQTKTGGTSKLYRQFMRDEKPRCDAHQNVSLLHKFLRDGKVPFVSAEEVKGITCTGKLEHAKKCLLRLMQQEQQVMGYDATPANSPSPKPRSPDVTGGSSAASLSDFPDLQIISAPHDIEDLSLPYPRVQCENCAMHFTIWKLKMKAVNFEIVHFVNGGPMTRDQIITMLAIAGIEFNPGPYGGIAPLDPEAPSFVPSKEASGKLKIVYPGGSSGKTIDHRRQDSRNSETQATKRKAIKLRKSLKSANKITHEEVQRMRDDALAAKDLVKDAKDEEEAAIAAKEKLERDKSINIMLRKCSDSLNVIVGGPFIFPELLVLEPVADSEVPPESSSGEPLEYFLDSPISPEPSECSLSADNVPASFFMRMVDPRSRNKPFCSFLPIDSLTYSNECGTHRYKCVWPAIPHTRCEVFGEKVKYMEEDVRLPQHMMNKLPRGRFCVATFRVVTEEFGYLGKSLGEPQEVMVSISMESLFSAFSRRLSDTGDFDCTYVRVQSMRSYNNDTNYDGRDVKNMSYISDLVFTSLLLISNRRQPHDALNAVGENILCRQVFSSLSKMDLGSGVVSFKGYNLAYDNIFGDKPISEVLDDNCAILYRGVKNAARKALTQCVAAPVSVATLLGRPVSPAFPCNFDKDNLILGWVKRLCPPRYDTTSRFDERFSEIVAHLVGLVEPTNLPDEVLRDMCLKTAMSKYSNPADIRDYMDGVADCITGNLDNFTNTYSGFLKSESYDHTKLKAPRNIVCPAHYLRGFYNALLLEFSISFTKATEKWNVKHCTTAQLIAKVDVFNQRNVNGLQSDFNSMESNVKRTHMQGCEKLLVLASSPHRSGLIEKVYSVISNTPSIVDAGSATLVLPPMRLSGKYDTALMNLALNLSWCFTIISCYKQDMGEADYDAGFVFSSVDAVFEGDDGLIATPHLFSEEEVTKLSNIAREGGLRLTFISDQTKNLSFCSKSLVLANTIRELDLTRREIVLNYADPLKMIVNSSVIRSVNDDMSRNGHEVLQNAGLLSRLFDHPHLPMFSPYAREILRKGKQSALVLYQEVIDFLEGKRDKLSTNAMLLYKDVAKGRDNVQELLVQFKSYVSFASAILSKRAVDIPSEMREKVFFCTGISPSSQIEFEKSVVDQIASGARVIRHGVFDDFLLHNKAVASVEAFRNFDIRSYIKGRWGSDDVPHMILNLARRVGSFFRSVWALIIASTLFLTSFGIITWPIVLLIAVIALICWSFFCLVLAPITGIRRSLQIYSGGLLFVMLLSAWGFLSLAILCYTVCSSEAWTKLGLLLQRLRHIGEGVLTPPEGVSKTFGQWVSGKILNTFTGDSASTRGSAAGTAVKKP